MANLVCMWMLVLLHRGVTELCSSFHNDTELWLLIRMDKTFFVCRAILMHRGFCVCMCICVWQRWTTSQSKQKPDCTVCQNIYDYLIPTVPSLTTDQYFMPFVMGTYYGVPFQLNI